MLCALALYEVHVALCLLLSSSQRKSVARSVVQKPAHEYQWWQTRRKKERKKEGKKGKQKKCNNNNIILLKCLLATVLFPKLCLLCNNNRHCLSFFSIDAVLCTIVVISSPTGRPQGLNNRVESTRPAILDRTTAQFHLLQRDGRRLRLRRCRLALPEGHVAFWGRPTIRRRRRSCLSSET